MRVKGCGIFHSLLLSGIMEALHLQKLAYDHKGNRDQHHTGGKGVDLRGNAPFNHGIDVKGQGRRIRARHKEADDKVIDGKGKGHEGPGDDAWRNHGKRYIAEGLQRRRVKVAGGLFDILPASFQTGSDGDDDKGQAERDVRHNQGRFPKGKTELGKRIKSDSPMTISGMRIGR